MKSTGIIRKVDELGRLVIPIELRRVLDISDKDYLEIYVENEKIILSKYTETCAFCNSSENIVTYKDKNICKNCLAEIKKLND